MCTWILKRRKLFHASLNGNGKNGKKMKQPPATSTANGTLWSDFKEDTNGGGESCCDIRRFIIFYLNCLSKSILVSYKRDESLLVYWSIPRKYDKKHRSVVTLLRYHMLKALDTDYSYFATVYHSFCMIILSLLSSSMCTMYELISFLLNYVYSYKAIAQSSKVHTLLFCFVVLQRSSF